MVRHGLVIGKFYPPHAGHHRLVNAAAECVEQLTVVVMAAHIESIPLDQRVRWMREVHDQANVRVVGIWDDHAVDLQSEDAWNAHVGLMRDAIATVTDLPVDAVFTSEPYGDELARRFGAVHAPVDIGRGLTPISGTAVRKDLVKGWPYLAPPVRQDLARRVTLIGAESTGKTTLCERLAQTLRARGGPFGDTRTVGEYGRLYTADLWAVSRAKAAIAGKVAPPLDQLVWTEPDFLKIAQIQNRWEDAEALVGGPVLLCDTDSFATAVWCRRYTGRRSASVEAIAHRSALYLLLDDDVPFIQDGLRDGEHIRGWMTGQFADQLAATGRRYIAIGGNWEQRFNQAIREIDALISEGTGFADPLG